jgi:hypothetical protein
MNIRVRNKTISYGSGFPANPILSALFFLDVGCLLTCLPYFLLFALWCNLNNLRCNRNAVCCLQLLLLEMFICCGNMPTDHSNCWSSKAKKIFEENLFYLSHLCSLNTDLRFARPKIRWWEAQNEGLMKIMSKRSTAHFAFCNN